MNIDDLWAIQLHPKGWSRYKQLKDLLPRACTKYARGEASEWVTLGVAPDLNSAKKQTPKLRKRIRELQQTNEERIEDE